jgi:hypothetical protein
MLAIYGWSEDRHACQGVLVSAVAGSEFMLGFVTSLAIESRLSAAEPKIRVEMDSAWLVRLNSPIDHVVGVLSGAAVGFCPGMLYLIGFKRTKTPWEVVVVVTCFVWIGVVVTYYFWLATHVRARLKAAVVAKNRSEPIKSPQRSDDAAVVVVAKYSSDDFKPPESSDDAAHRPDEKR